jgi:hypothetical protein
VKIKQILNNNFIGSMIGFLGIISLYFGIINLLKYGNDCQIEGSNFLINNISPYKVFFENRSLFRFTRIPTHLPQEYYILSIFAVLGDYWGYLLYGITGAVIFFIYDFEKTKNKNSLILIFLLFATTTYRNNLGLGQFLFFYFGIFLFFDKIIRSENYGILKTYIACPILLLMLASKPTTFFWIPLFYSINKKNIKIYIITLFLQICVIYFFAFQTDVNLNDFFKQYLSILFSHSNLSYSVNSVFSINFSNLIGGINSTLVIFNFILILFVFLLQIKNKITLNTDFYLFLLINLSFIFVYHSNSDSFLLLTPLFISKPQEIFSKRNYFLIALMLFMIIEKFIFLIDFGNIGQYLVNFFTIVFSILHITKQLFINLKGNFS